MSNQGGDEVSGQGKAITINLRLINRFLAVLVVSSFGFYLAGINNLSVKGFGLSEKKIEVAELVELNRQLSIRANTLQSLSHISQRVEDLELVNARDVVYIDAYSTLARQ